MIQGIPEVAALRGWNGVVDALGRRHAAGCCTSAVNGVQRAVVAFSTDRMRHPEPQGIGRPAGIVAAFLCRAAGDILRLGMDSTTPGCHQRGATRLRAGAESGVHVGGQSRPPFTLHSYTRLLVQNLEKRPVLSARAEGAGGDVF